MISWEESVQMELTSYYLNTKGMGDDSHCVYGMADPSKSQEWCDYTQTKDNIKIINRNKSGQMNDKTQKLISDTFCTEKELLQINISFADGVNLIHKKEKLIPLIKLIFT